MADDQSRLEITARVIDLGHMVIQLHHVVSAGRHAVHPFRPAGVALMLVGLGLIGSEAFMRGVQAFKLQTGGSLPLWLGFAAIGIGLFLVLYARRILLIRTSDGGRVELPASTEEAAVALVHRLLEAMEMARPTAPTTVALETTEATAGRGSSPLALPQQPMQGVRPQFGEGGIPQTVPLGRRPDGSVARGGVVAIPSEGGTTADGFPGGYRLAGMEQQQAVQIGLAAERRGPTDPVQQTALREAVVLPGSGPGRHEGAHDLAALMDHVRRADLQHKEALLDLLRVVEDHYRGRASRDDAIAHWRSFADYVVQYLGDVDGLLAHTERFGRHMLR